MTINLHLHFSNTKLILRNIFYFQTNKSDIQNILEIFPKLADSQQNIIMASLIQNDQSEMYYKMINSAFNIGKKKQRTVVEIRKKILLEQPIVDQRESQIFKIDADIMEKIYELYTQNSSVITGRNSISRIKLKDIKDRNMLSLYEIKRVEKVTELYRELPVEYLKATKQVLRIDENELYSIFQTEVSDVSFYSFKLCKPFFIEKNRLNWQNMCICPICANFRSGMLFFNKLGDAIGNQSLQNLSVENCWLFCLCKGEQNRPFSEIYNCLHSKKYSHCFRHLKKRKNCQYCWHECDSGFKEFIAKELTDFDFLEYVIKVPFFDVKEKKFPTFVPTNDVRSKNLSPQNMFDKCMSFILDGILHYEITTYSKQFIPSGSPFDTNDLNNASGIPKDMVIMENDYASNIGPFFKFQMPQLQI